MSFLPPFPEIPPVYHRRVLFVYLMGMFIGVVLGAAIASEFPLTTKAQSRPRHPSNDIIFACLQKEGMPVYAVGPDGPPLPGDVVTASMVTVVCVEEK